MRIATWNVNNRVGLTKFRLGAANAILAVDPDIAVITEYFPKTNDQSFREVLTSGGLFHQTISKDPTGAANRVLIASRYRLEDVTLQLPEFDIDFPANVVATRVRDFDLTVLGVRIPWYKGPSRHFTAKSWDWLEITAAALKSKPAVITGDFNVQLTSTAARGAAHFNRMLANGWQRAAPEGSSFRNARSGNQIDHLLASTGCALGPAELVRRVGNFELCDGDGALSDHAALVVEVTVNGRDESDAYLYALVDDVPDPPGQSKAVRKQLVDLGLTEEEAKRIT